MVRVGSTGPVVLALQKVLQSGPVDDGPFYAAALDGRFGPITEVFGAAFQTSRGIAVDDRGRVRGSPRRACPGRRSTPPPASPDPADPLPLSGSVADEEAATRLAVHDLVDVEPADVVDLDGGEL